MSPLVRLLLGMWVVWMLAGLLAIRFMETRGMRLLNVDTENSLPTWFSIIDLAMAGGLALTTAWQMWAQNRFVAWGWGVGGVILLAMSAEEQVMVHERLSPRLQDQWDTDGYLMMAWVVPGLALSALVLASGWPFLRRLPRQTALQFLLAAGVFVMGAIGMEMMAGKVVTHSGVFDLTYYLLTIAEEGLEMLGVIIAIDAILRYRRMQGLSVRF